MKNKELKKCIKVINDIGEKLDRIVNDGKIKWVSLGFFLLGKIKGIVYLVKNGKVALDEYEDLDTPGKKDFNEWFAGDFDIKDDVLEAEIEEAVRELTELVDSELIRKARNILKRIQGFKRQK